MDKEYDLIILGGGPAGLTAGLYAARARLRTLLIEKAVPGGQIATTTLVENFPGFPEGVMGPDLAERMQQQAESFGLETTYDEVTGIELTDGLKRVKTLEGDYLAKALIIATGADAVKLGVPGEDKLIGKGVSYCATCDGAFFKDQVIAVVGGGDSALDEGLFLTRFGSKVIVIHRRDQLRASKVLQERAFANPKMAFIWDSVVEEVIGDDEVKALRLRNVKTGESSLLDVSGVFVYIGHHPNTTPFKGLVSLDERGYVITTDKMETSVPGVFVAGDVRVNSARQAITAAGDGATAALTAEKYIAEHFD